MPRKTRLSFWTRRFSVTVVVILLLEIIVCNAIVFNSGSGEDTRLSNNIDKEDIKRSSREIDLPYVDRSREQQYYSEGGRILADKMREISSNNLYLSEQEEDKEKELKDTRKSRFKWEGWNYIDTSKSGWSPHEKTISVQFLDDDGKYSHAPPAWPHDEYMFHFQRPGLGGPFGLKNGNESEDDANEANKGYEWHKIRPQQQQPSRGVFIGPGFYEYNPAYHAKITQSAAAAATAAASVDTGEDGTLVPNAVSESATTGKLYGGGGGYPYGASDYYRRKRLRFAIHPGILAAPIAGFAAYKAVSAIASKPLLLEMGWVGNKPRFEVDGGGWGWPAPIWPGQAPVPPPAPYPYPYLPHPPVVPHYPHPVPAYLPHHVVNAPIVPVLAPKRRPERSWWSRFAALTPRFLSKKADRACCDRDDIDVEKRDAEPEENTILLSYNRPEPRMDEDENEEKAKES